MLEMRFLRSGRRNNAFFRVVLTESSKPPKSGFIKVLGWFDPYTKKTSLKKEKILSWIDKGAKPSNKLSKLLLAEGIKHKHIIYIPKAKKDAKTKKEPTKQPKIEQTKPKNTEEKTEIKKDIQASKEPEQKTVQEEVQPEKIQPEEQKTKDK